MISLKVSYSNKISLRVLLCESYDNDDGSSGSDDGRDTSDDSDNRNDNGGDNDIEGVGDNGSGGDNCNNNNVATIMMR